MTGYVYLISCGNYLKVGSSNNPPSRLMYFNVHLPYEVKLVGAFEYPCEKSAMFVEKEIHARLKANGLHHKYEWFHAGVDTESISVLTVNEYSYEKIQQHRRRCEYILFAVQNMYRGRGYSKPAVQRLLLSKGHTRAAELLGCKKFVLAEDGSDECVYDFVVDSHRHARSIGVKTNRVDSPARWCLNNK